jgi:hypothetical protein
MTFKGTSKLVKLFKGTTKVKYIYKGTDKVWSGASIVSYYDGETLLGTQEIDEGVDVLRPNITTAKEGYTLYGWGLTSDATERVESLVASGEPMTLYAIYTANSVTAVSNGSIINSDYVTGSVYTSVSAFWSTKSSTTYFQLLKRRYQTASCTVRSGFNNNSTGNLQVGKGSIDGIIIGDWQTGGSEAYRTVQLNDGTHSLSVSCTSYEDYTQSGDIKVTSLVLSNPIAWG